MLCTVALIGKAHAVKNNEVDATSATYAVRLVQQALASGVCDPKSGDGITGNDKVKVTKETMSDGSVVCLADVEDLKKIDLDLGVPQVYTMRQSLCSVESYACSIECDYVKGVLPAKLVPNLMVTLHYFSHYMHERYYSFFWSL